MFCYSISAFIGSLTTAHKTNKTDQMNQCTQGTISSTLSLASKRENYQLRRAQLISLISHIPWLMNAFPRGQAELFFTLLFITGVPTNNPSWEDFFFFESQVVPSLIFLAYKNQKPWFQGERLSSQDTVLFQVFRGSIQPLPKAWSLTASLFHFQGMH